ncbi:MAG: 2-C-methyl-D-erythritol 4-phosphate cytidylyltransferase [Muribaculaceae bacterium]|nr:2-C-methyl-D-erythritol 4-phosphate cytidylyltransferase [Muribaculaceae bacterium]
MSKRNIHIIVVAGGTGSRFGSDVPKQYCMLGDRPVLCHTIERLKRAVPDAHIITVVSAPMADHWRQLATDHSCPTGDVVIGGSTRWESVKNALDTITAHGDSDIVLVHDGARPLIDATTVDEIIAACKPATSVVPVTPVTDSLRRLMPDGSSVAVTRSDYRAVATPQGFMVTDLKCAYTLPYRDSFTDDASVMAAAGMDATTLVESSPRNIKITNPGDIALASWYISQES